MKHRKNWRRQLTSVLHKRIPCYRFSLVAYAVMRTGLYAQRGPCDYCKRSDKCYVFAKTKEESLWI